MIDQEQEIARLKADVKALRARSPLQSATVLAANPALQTATLSIGGVTTPNVQVLGTYIPEAGHQVQVLMNGTEPIVYPPAKTITSAAPAQVTGVTVTPGMGSLVVRWAALTEADVKWNRGYYQVQVDTSSAFNTGNLKSVDSPGTVSVVTDLVAGTAYFVRVRGVDYVGQVGAYSSTVSGTPNKVDGAADIVANSIVAGTIAANAIDASELAAISIGVGKYIRSTTYVAGSAGWSIDAAGSAEFSNAIVRGTVDAAAIKASTMTGIIAVNQLTNPGAETNTTGWTGNNCTLTRTTTAGQFRSGVGAFKLQASSAADMYIETPTGTGGFAVVPGVCYSAIAFFKTAVTSRVCTTELRLFNAAGTFTTSYPVVVENSTNFWRSGQSSSFGPIPAGSVFASVRLKITAPANAEVHYIDDVALNATSTISTDISTGPAGAPSVDIYSDAIPQILLFSGIDGEAVAQIYRTQFRSGQQIDLTTLTIYSGYPSGGSAAFLQLDSSGVITGKSPMMRINAGRAYLNDGVADWPLVAHANGTGAFGPSISTTSTLPVEPGTTLRITNFVKRHAESYIKVTLYANSIFCSTGFGSNARIFVNHSGGTDEIARVFCPGDSTHQSMAGSRFILGGSAAGNYTFQWRWASSTAETINIDGNGSYFIEVEEIAAP